MKRLDPSNCETAPEALSKLAKSKSKTTQRLVAENPNTPIPVLQKLWLKYPECVLSNPLLTLWEFSSPDLISEFVSHQVLLEVFNYHKGNNLPLPKNLFNQQRLGLITICAMDIRNPAIFIRLPYDPDESVRETFITSIQPHPRCCFFYDAAPDSVWIALATDASENVALKFAELIANYEPAHGTVRSVFYESVLLLIRRGNSKILNRLARSRRLSSEAIDLILEKGGARARTFLAGAPTASEEAQKLMATDSAKSVRLAMAKCEVSSNIFREFKINDDINILIALLSNKKTPNDIRCRIVHEAHRDVQKALCDSSTYLAPPFYFAVKDYLTEETLVGICARLGLHHEILQDLAKSSSESVRMAVAENLDSKLKTHPPALIQSIACKLLSDVSDSVRVKAMVFLGLGSLRI